MAAMCQARLMDSASRETSSLVRFRQFVTLGGQQKKNGQRCQHVTSRVPQGNTKTKVTYKVDAGCSVAEGPVPQPVGQKVGTRSHTSSEARKQREAHMTTSWGDREASGNDPRASPHSALVFWDNRGAYVEACTDHWGIRWSQSPAPWWI